jgi:hypothetical protein
MSPDGSQVDYDSLVGSDAFSAYVHTAQQLQWVAPQEVAALGEGGKRAAWLNLYNALVMHALAVGPRYVVWNVCIFALVCRSIPQKQHRAPNPITINNTPPSNQQQQPRLLPRPHAILQPHRLPRGGGNFVPRRSRTRPFAE